MILLKPARECQESLAEDYAKGYYRPGCYQVNCFLCGKVFYARRPEARYCSYRCTNDANIARRRDRRKQARNKYCAYCKKAFTAKRRDAKYCSPACRQASYRQYVTNTGSVYISTTVSRNRLPDITPGEHITP